MINAKTLSEEQIAAIRAWAEAGDRLPEIQQRLAEELSLKATFLETRFLLEDLGIELLPEPEPEPEEATAEEGGDGEEPPEPTDPGTGELEGDAAAVTIDQVQRPGAMVSGKVRFAGGQTISWWLDQLGRLGIDPPEGFEPTEGQMISFQKALQSELRRNGFI